MVFSVLERNLNSETVHTHRLISVDIRLMLVSHAMVSISYSYTIWYYGLLISILLQFVLLVISGWLVDLWTVRDVLRCATTTNGAQSVIMDGILLMLTLLVISLGFQDSVGYPSIMWIPIHSNISHRCKCHYFCCVWSRKGSCSSWECDLHWKRGQTLWLYEQWPRCFQLSSFPWCGR